MIQASSTSRSHHCRPYRISPVDRRLRDRLGSKPPQQRLYGLRPDFRPGGSLGQRLHRPAFALIASALLFIAPAAFAQTVAVTGTVSNSLTGQGISGATATFATLNATFSDDTDENGSYSVSVPANVSYEVTFAAESFDAKTLSGSLVEAEGTVLDASLDPVDAVIVEATADGVAEPGETLSLSGVCTPLDGSAVLGTEWVQTEGTMAGIADFMVADTTVTLAPLGAYKDELIRLLEEPPIGPEELPPNVPLPEGEFVGGLRKDRTQVVAVMPYNLERATDVQIAFDCETTSGVYSATVDLPTEVPWEVSTGLRTVPLRVPVLVYAAESDSYDWQIVGKPPASSAELVDAATQTAWFTPDTSGVYELTEQVSGKTLTVHSGLWQGAIDIDLTIASVASGDGLPVGDFNSCTFFCHVEGGGGAAPDVFTSWRETGHANAFSDGLNENSHFGEGCFACHAVGVNFDADNAGMDDRSGYHDFVDNSGLLNNPDPGNWLTMLFDYPDVAKMANIQCENCHGPQSNFTRAHGGVAGAPRVSIASEVCGSCHGEPARHGRYQQWQISRHANYELATAEGDSGNCSRCHTGNGFIAWTKDGNDPDQEVTVTWDAQSVHPQTCAACHGPHNTGTTSGSNPDAGVRIDGDTPMLAAGFQLLNVGKGALCMTCHNSRRGLRNDSNWATTTDKDRAPHGPTQADLLASQNAYFISLGRDLNHRTIAENGGTCVACHMEKTPPPDLLSYNQSGTNHTFFAGKDVCANCHDNIPTADGVQGTTSGLLTQLQAWIQAKYIAEMVQLINGGASLDLAGEATITSPEQIQGVTLGESRGRQTLDIQVSGIADPVSVSLGAVTISGGPADGMTLYDLSDTLMKATWNYHLVGNDGGLGVHNPPFSYAALQAAIDEVSAL